MARGKCWVCGRWRKCGHGAPIGAVTPALPAVYWSTKMQAEVVLPAVTYHGGWLDDGATFGKGVRVHIRHMKPCLYSLPLFDEGE